MSSKKDNIQLLEEALQQANRQIKLGDQAILELKKAKSNLSLYKFLFQNSSDGIIITDAHRKIIEVNPAFVEVTGYSTQEIIGKNPKILSSGKHDAAFFKAMSISIETTGSWMGEIWNRRKNGEIYPEWLKINSIVDQQGKVTHYFALFTDISGQKKVENQLINYAYHDPLTKLDNRMGCFNGIENAILSAKRNHQLIAVFFMDLDHFKQVNDQYGHRIGDYILKEVANRIRKCVREEDIVARIGGDEFVVVLKNIHNVDNAKKSALNIIAAVQKSYDIDHSHCNIGISIGISLYPDHAQQSDDLIMLADAAMYEAKKLGNSVIVYQPFEKSTLK